MSTGCAHLWELPATRPHPNGRPFRGTCARCGARRAFPSSTGTGRLEAWREALGRQQTAHAGRAGGDAWLRLSRVARIEAHQAGRFR